MSGMSLQREDHDGVATLTLADVGTRNSLSEAMLAALAETVDMIGKDDEVRCVVLSADGPVFSSGHNLKEMQAHRNDPDRGLAYVDGLFATCAQMMTRIVRLPKPVVAAVEGLATAAGCQLVATCDLAVAGSAARFQTPGVNKGLFCSTPAVAVSRAMASKHALQMLLLGEPIDAETAFRFGLVNEVVPEGQALAAAQALAAKIAGKRPCGYRHGKPTFHRQLQLPLDDAYDAARTVMVENFLEPDVAEGTAALLEKRPPRW
jgi:enoyl-CoA hydratase/carnithine racemase